MRYTLQVLLSLAACLTTSSFATAATIPAGTPLIARTTNSISSHARPGGTFTAKLDQDIVVNGNVLLRAGTQLSGVIQTSRGSRSTTSSNPLTLNLTGISVNGRTVPIKTTGAFEPSVQAKTTRQSRSGASVGESFFPAGTRLEFRLAKALNL